MTTREIIENHCRDYLENTGKRTKYEWAATNVLNLTTDDSELDVLFVKKIVEVCKTILNRETFEYIRDENRYIHYILGGAWFDEYDEPLPILKYYLEDYVVDTIPFTEQNLRILIDFIEHEG